MNRTLFSITRVLCLAICVNLQVAGQDIQESPKSKDSTSSLTSLPAAPGIAHAAPKVSFDGMPLSFEPNLGQADSTARFISRNAGYSLRLESTGARFQFNGRDKSVSAIVRMDLVNANREAVIAGESMLLGKSDYFPTGDPKTWITNIPTYSRVHYKDIYPGVDPDWIRIQLSGSDNANITSDGDLVLHPGKSNLRFLKPVVYQMSSDGKTRELVSATYVLNDTKDGEPTVRFALGKYDHHRQLVIDPVVALDYSQYLFNYVGEVAVDSSGNSYVTGNYGSTGFYVTKFNSRGKVG